MFLRYKSRLATTLRFSTEPSKVPNFVKSTTFELALHENMQPSLGTYLSINSWISFVHPGLGCDTSIVIRILARRDATQRALIQEEYRAMFSEDLLKRLSKELIGKLEVWHFVHIITIL